MKFIKDWFNSKTDISVTNIEAPTESTADFLSRYGETEPVDMVIKYIENNLDNFTIEIGKYFGGGIYTVVITDGVVEITGRYTYSCDMTNLDKGVVVFDDTHIIYSFLIAGLPTHLYGDFSDKVVPSITKLVKRENKRQAELRLKERQEEQRQSIEYFTKLLGGK